MVPLARQAAQQLDIGLRMLFLGNSLCLIFCFVGSPFLLTRSHSLLLRKRRTHREAEQNCARSDAEPFFHFGPHLLCN
jgi:hypothetical protein